MIFGQKNDNNNNNNHDKASLFKTLYIQYIHKN